MSVHVCLSFCPVQESISTCRFAQRVAMIKNDVLLNEEIDPKLVSFCHIIFLYKKRNLTRKTLNM